MNILKELNKQQLAAVTHFGGHELVIAGAGTGKTRVLTYRIAWLINEGLAKRSEIMALTFTNKAAKEMKERLVKLIGPEARQMAIGTFHAICSRFLRQYGAAIDIDSNFIIYDTYDQLTIIKNLLNELGLDPKTITPNGILSKIDSFKNRGLTPEKATCKEFDILGNYALKLYGTYQKALRRAAALDFGDLIMECLHLWRQDKELLDYCRRRYKYVLVDEFQDTNEVQLEFLKTLAFGPEGSTIFAVGDDDQSIYSWRGANPANMKYFEKHFGGATCYKLEENYRSTCAILDAANLLIENNEERRPKKLFSQNMDMKKPLLLLAPGAEEEAAMVGGTILKAVQGGANLEDFAILMRTNAQSRPFEQVLRTAGLNYTIVGGTAFFARKEIKDLLAALRLLFWPDSDADFQRVLTNLTAGIGEQTINKLLAFSAKENSSVGAILAGGEPKLKTLGFNKRAIVPLLALNDLLASLRTAAGELTPVQLAQKAIKDLALLDSLKGDPHAEEREENIEELLRLIALRHDAGITLPEFLREISLDESSAAQDSPGKGVTISTIHAAKGLEFNTVFLVGMEEGLLPHANSLRSADRAQNPAEKAKYIEEERRLCYVGITRARRTLYITAAGSRRSLGGGFKEPALSRFIKEMGIEAHPLSRQGKTPGHIAPHIQRRLHMGGHLDIDLDEDDNY